MTDAEVIAKELADTYIFFERKHNRWNMSDVDTANIRKHLEQCLLCSFEQIDGMLDSCKEVMADDIADMRREYHLKKKYPSLEEIERDAYINQVLKPQVEILNRR